MLLIAVGVNDARAQPVKLIGGVSMGSMASDSDVATSRLPGAVFGGGLEWTRGSVTPEIDVLWIQKRGRYDSRAWDFTVSEISVPVVVAVRGSGRIAPFGLAGAEVAYILSASQSDTSGGHHVSYETPTIDYGFVVGGGVRAGISGRRLSIEARYLHGLAKTMKFFSDGFDFKTRTFVLVASVQ
jgi:hypothetical protein